MPILLKSLIIKLVFHFIEKKAFDLVIDIAKKKAEKTENTIDDAIVESIEENKLSVIAALQAIKKLL